MSTEMTSKVYSATPVEDDQKLYELATRMKLLADEVKTVNSTTKLNRLLKSGDELADTVLEFLKVSGWSRS